MEFSSVNMSRKELRRFLEIANGRTTASNTPEEDALFRKGLVKEAIMIFADLDIKSSTVDERAIVLSDLGREYYAQHMNQQKKNKQDAWRFWLTTIIAIAGLVLMIIFELQ